MASMVPVLNEHIRRLARREVRAESKATRCMMRGYRRDITELRGMIRRLAKRVDILNRGGGGMAAPAELLKNVRFRADGLRSHRARLGISARDYGRLLGVSALTIYNWESGKARPRKRQLAALLAARPLGKREVIRRLAGLDGRGGVS